MTLPPHFNIRRLLATFTFLWVQWIIQHCFVPYKLKCCLTICSNFKKQLNPLYCHLINLIREMKHKTAVTKSTLLAPKELHKDFYNSHLLDRNDNTKSNIIYSEKNTWLKLSGAVRQWRSQESGQRRRGRWWHTARGAAAGGEQPEERRSEERAAGSLRGRRCLTASGASGHRRESKHAPAVVARPVRWQRGRGVVVVARPWSEE
jgi:hypothetical protein